VSEAIRFLHTLAQALSTMVLYSPGHPATRRSIEGAWQALTALLRVDDHPLFFFIGTAPVYSGRALHELRDWPYARRLTEAGIQRLEFDATVTEAALTEFFNRLMVRLNTGTIPFEESQEPMAGILFGSVTVEEVATAEGEATGAVPGESHVQLNVDLSDEIEAMGYVLDEGVRGVVARAEVEAVSRILGGLLEQYDAPQVPFSEEYARYQRIHPLNTALLSMAGARAAGVDPAGRHRLGVAALFHDIGMTRLRPGLGNLASLSPEERTLIETHPQEGARMLLDSGGRGLELAATVAYEHQLRPDGGGYPQRRFRPVPHWASRLVGTAAAFVALRAPRPFRPAWSAERALRALEEGAGTVYDAEAARLLVGVVRGA
jgi:HD-GYP domain-containing protein (c-di-GMP phosphodiesterase class II)